MKLLENNKVKIYNISTHSDDWYKFRSTGTSGYIGGTGASESGIYFPELSGTSYKTKSQFWMEKVGMLPYSHFDNNRMFFGRLHEAMILLLWEFWDGSEDGYMNNYKEFEKELKEEGADGLLVFGVDELNKLIYHIAQKHKIRHAYKPEGYITHSDYPYLFASPDGLCEDGFSLITGEKVPLMCVECKNLGENTVKYHGTFSCPDSYVIQLNHQMLLTDTDYAELVIHIGGNDLTVMGFERSDYLINNIIKENTMMWENHILPARDKHTMYLQTNKEEYLADAMQYEPDVDGNPLYKKHFSERFTANEEEISMKGDDELEAIVKMAKEYAEYKGQLEKLEQMCKNKITHKFVHEKADRIWFEELGNMRYYKKPSNNNYELSIRGIRYKPDKEVVAKKMKDILKIINKI